MMDHVCRQSKEQSKEQSSDEGVPRENESDNVGESSYYYDDSLNYEIYRADDDEEADEDQED
jgi:hypothetical protein